MKNSREKNKLITSLNAIGNLLSFGVVVDHRGYPFHASYYQRDPQQGRHEEAKGHSWKQLDEASPASHYCKGERPGPQGVPISCELLPSPFSSIAYYLPLLTKRSNCEMLEGVLDATYFYIVQASRNLFCALSSLGVRLDAI